MVPASKGPLGFSPVTTASPTEAGSLESRRDKPIVTWHDVPGKAFLENRPVGYGMVGRQLIPDQRHFSVRRVSSGRLNTLLERLVSDDARAAARWNGPNLRDTNAE